MLTGDGAVSAREPYVVGEFKNIQRQVEAIGKLAADLEGRLSPLARPSIPTPQGIQKDPQDDSQVPPFALALRNEGSKLRTAALNLESLLDRLEL